MRVNDSQLKYPDRETFALDSSYQRPTSDVDTEFRRGEFDQAQILLAGRDAYFGEGV